jgi:hypothetical protein
MMGGAPTTPALGIKHYACRSIFTAVFSFARWLRVDCDAQVYQRSQTKPKKLYVPAKLGLGSARAPIEI